MVVVTSGSSDSLTERILCYYVNATNRLQIAQIKNIPGFQFERLVFPHQRLLFEATLEATLDIYTETTANLTPSEQISCAQLQVNRNIKTHAQ